MAKLNSQILVDNEITKSSCSVYLQSCLSEHEYKQLMIHWDKIKTIKTTPFWKFCFDNIEVTYKPKDEQSK